jgi:hypothetical protein
MLSISALRAMEAATDALAAGKEPHTCSESRRSQVDKPSIHCLVPDRYAFCYRSM